MWPFKKKKPKLSSDIRKRLSEYLVWTWWTDMKPDWISIKKICPNIPTSWYIQVSDNVYYTNDSRGIYG